MIVVWVRDIATETAETAAAETARRALAAMLDALPVPVWRRASDLALAYANKAYREAVEADAATQPARLAELNFGAGGAGHALAEAAAQSGAAREASGHVVVAGARRLLDIHEIPESEGRGLVGFALDRTAVEDASAELARHIAAHKEVLHHLGTAITIYGADQRLAFFNHAFVHLWQLDEQWLRGAPTMSEVLEELRAGRRLPEYADFRAFKKEQLKQFTSLLDPVEELVHLPDGTTLRAVTSPHPFGGLLLTWEDVTPALTLERNYNTLIAVQRETLDNLYEGVAVTGADGRLTLSNPAFGRIWQMPTELLVAAPHMGEIVDRMRHLLEVGENWPEARERIIGALTDRSPRTERIERTDGSVLDGALVPLPDGAVLLSHGDVSDSIRVERALRERNEALETADRLKSEFIANVSYELRMPLNTIIGFAEILTGQYFGALNERQTEYSRGILDSSHRLLSLINDILDLAMIEAGHMQLELEPVDLHETLSTVLSLTRERARKKKLNVEFDCAPDIGTLVADERRLKQALFNILSNSLKFTPENGVIRVSARREADRIVPSFVDTGIGIPDKDRPRIFEKFERGSNPEARRSGAGLGLSLVKSFIEMHGGTVELESASGIGTQVTCSLPATTTVAPAEAVVEGA